jgi:TRAP-type C4-dicarboxylate transport system permease small subunit
VGFEKVISKFYRIIKPVSKVSSGIGMVCLAVMMLLTTADVFLRYVFDKPITGSYELIQFMMAITVSLGLAYCGLEKGHVTIDVLTSHFPERIQAIIDSIVGFLGLLVAAVMTWQGCIYVLTIGESHLLSSVLLIPVYPFVAIVAFGLALYAIVLVLHLLEFIAKGMHR